MAPRFASLSLLVLLIFCAVGCASAPAIADPSGVEVTASILTDKEISIAFGLDDGTNPFFVPKGLLIPRTNEFIVLRTSARAAKKASFELISLRAKAADGSEPAKFYELEAFNDFWRDWSNDDELLATRIATIKKHYLPGWSYSFKGSSKKAMVLIGHKPIPRPLEVELIYSIDGGTPRTIKLEAK